MAFPTTFAGLLLQRTRGLTRKFGLFPCVFKRAHYVCWNNVISSKRTVVTLAKTASLAVSAVGLNGNSDTASTGTTFEPNDPRLRSHECLKNAAGLSVDSTSAVLSQTVYAISKAEEQYREMINVLLVLIEYQIQVLGHTAEEERIGELIVETRHEVQKLLQRKQDLHLLFASVEKLADATAEVAFATGCEYASTSAGERLYSAQKEVTRHKALSEEAERQIQEATVKSINALTKHEEKRKKAEEISKEKKRTEESEEVHTQSGDDKNQTTQKSEMTVDQNILGGDDDGESMQS